MPISASTWRCACRSTSLLRRRASSSCAAAGASARQWRRQRRQRLRLRALAKQRPRPGRAGARATHLQVLEVQAAGLPGQVLEGRLLGLPVVGLRGGQGDLRGRRPAGASGGRGRGRPGAGGPAASQGARGAPPAAAPRAHVLVLVDEREVAIDHLLGHLADGHHGLRGGAGRRRALIAVHGCSWVPRRAAPKRQRSVDAGPAPASALPGPRRGSPRVSRMPKIRCSRVPACGSSRRPSCPRSALLTAGPAPFGRTRRRALEQEQHGR